MVKKVKKLVKKVKKSVVQKSRRRLELSYVNKMIKTLTKASGSGHGAAMVKNKDGKVEMVHFKTKAEAIALLNRVRQGELSLVFK